jgi:hypothetical protein
MKRLYLSCVILFLLVGLIVAKQSAPAKAPKGILRHTVAFNFKSDVPQETIEKVLADARATLPRIAGTSNIIVGTQTSSWTKYKYGISIDFVNKDAKEAYAKSPESKRLHEEYKPLTEDEVVIDILSE